ncbi:MAG: DUF3108 domain-containing protein [Gemmobacter sp.]|jgi:hypothetical protein|nr:DUF3108 domain-containing protein [Gemmobacter sp.]
MGILGKRMVLAAALAAGLAGAGRAEQAQFDFVLHGITAGNLTWNGTGEPGGAYAVRGTLKTTGLAAMLRKVHYEATAKGRITSKGVYTPSSYVENANTGRRQSQVRMVWKKGVPVIESYQPARAPRPYDIDPATQSGTVDPLTAMFAALRDVAPGQECKINLKMFDGRRASAVKLGAPKRQGDKVSCSGEYRRVAGFSPEDMTEKTRFPFTLTYAPADNGQMRVVEVAMDSLYGKARLVRR